MINQKQKINAATSYFFLAAFFMLPSKNTDIKNDFVISHSKSALFLQLALIVSYIVFIHFGYFSEIILLGQHLNHVLMIISSIFILFLMTAGIFRANSGEDFSVFNNISFKKPANLLGKRGEKYTEKDKLFTIFSYIPFLGILINKDNKEEPIFSIAKFSSLIGLLFAFGYLLSAENLISLSILFYLIFVIFVGLFLFIKDEILFFNLNLPTIKDIYLNIITALVYIRNLIFSKEFIEYKSLKSKLSDFLDKKDKEEKELLSSKNNCEINNKLFYFPLLNIFGLIFLKTNAKNHIISGLIISIILVLFYIFDLTNYNLFLLFFICYGLANSEKIEYKVPFIYDIYAIIKNIIISIRNLFSKAKKTSEEKTTSMKAGEKK